MVAPTKMNKGQLLDHVRLLRDEVEHLRAAAASGEPAGGPGVVVRVPFHHLDGYASRHIDLHLSRRHAEVLRDVWHGLSVARATIPSRGTDRVVQSQQDALRWILERVREGMEPGSDTP